PAKALPSTGWATMRLAIAVPVPAQSVLPPPLPAAMSAPSATCPLSCVRLASTPESTTATTSPSPRLPDQAWPTARRRDAQSDVVPAEPLGAHRSPSPAGGVVPDPGPTYGALGFLGIDVGRGPMWTPLPTASHGNTSDQPAVSCKGSLSFPPSGWRRP